MCAYRTPSDHQRVLSRHLIRAIGSPETSRNAAHTMNCFGCFGGDPHPKAARPTPSDTKQSSSVRHRSTQVSDVTHLLGPVQPKQQNRMLAAIQAPQFGEHAYELIGEVGNTQNAGDMKLARHKRSKELVGIKCIKQSAGQFSCHLLCNPCLSVSATLQVALLHPRAGVPHTSVRTSCRCNSGQECRERDP